MAGNWFEMRGRLDFLNGLTCHCWGWSFTTLLGISVGRLDPLRD